MAPSGRRARQQDVKDATHKALTAVAKALGGDVHVLVAGKGCRPVAETAAKLAGVTKVLIADGDGYEHMLAEPVAALVHSLAGGYDAIVAPATTTGKNIMPRVAALLDVMQISDIVKVIVFDTFERLIYAGNAVQTVRSKDKIKVIMVRTSTFQAAGEGGAAAIEEASPPLIPASRASSARSCRDRSDRSSPRPGSSFPAAGRCKAENFTKYIEPVADKLGAASAPRAPPSMPATR